MGKSWQSIEYKNTKIKCIIEVPIIDNVKLCY